MAKSYFAEVFFDSFSCVIPAQAVTNSAQRVLLIHAAVHIFEFISSAPEKKGLNSSTSNPELDKIRPITKRFLIRISSVIFSHNKMDKILKKGVLTFGRHLLKHVTIAEFLVTERK
jgi:hypothetical protein